MTTLRTRHLLLTLALAVASTTTWAQQRLLGGDISLLPSYVEAGIQYSDHRGHAVEPLTFFQQQGWNAMRVRLFVNPDNAPGHHRDEGVCQDLPYVVALSQQIKQAGMQLMLDFHYSDYWADPAKQTIPAEWTDHSVQALCDSVYQHTRQSLLALQAAGAEPELIQVGNEITNGMLWPVAKLDPTKDEVWPQLCQLLSAGCRACREVCPQARIIIHTEKAGSWPVTKSYYTHLQQYGVDYDIIGLSYYPMWHGTVPNLGCTLDSLAQRFPQKEVMIVETAAYYSHENDRWATPDQYAEFYPISVRGQARFTRELTRELRRHHNVTGLFWWYPEENAYHPTDSTVHVTRGWLNRGLFNNHTGQALPALRQLRRFR